jgi:bifunctional DNA-binding transcriptional regulator/antitoxin component of YhaV-PrlF toxin-antitoxin module
MESTMTTKGQVVIPQTLRKKYRLEPGMKVQWIDMGTVIKLIPIPKDPIDALRGCAKNEGLTSLLLETRKMDKSIE